MSSYWLHEWLESVQLELSLYRLSQSEKWLDTE